MNNESSIMDDLKKFIQKRKNLFWYIKDTINLSEESAVEHILNYGDWNDVQILIKILGIKKVAKIFREQTSSKRMRINYDLKVKHYFTLYFKEYA